MKKEITAIFLLIFLLGCNAASDIGSDSGPVVKIPLSEVSNDAKFFSHKAGSVEIRYFAVLGSDGKPRIAFDACDVCGGYKGYKQIGNDIQCNNCGRVFWIDGLGTKNKGYGCWPSYLPHKIQGDNIVIKISDIEDSRHRFA